MGGIGTIAAIGGFLLALVLVYAVLSNERRSRADKRRTDEATKDLYVRIDRQDQISDSDHKPR